MSKPVQPLQTISEKTAGRQQMDEFRHFMQNRPTPPGYTPAEAIQHKQWQKKAKALTASRLAAST